MRGGDEVPADDLPAIEIDDEGGVVATLEASATTGSSLRLVLMAVGVLAAAAVVSWIFSSGSDDEPAAASTTIPETTTTAVEEEATLLAPVVPGTVDELIAVLNEIGVAGSVAYPSDENIVAIDFDTGDVEIAEITIRPEQDLTGFVLVASGRRTVALDPGTAIAYLITAAGRVVRGGGENDYVVVPADEPLTHVLTGRIDVAPNLALLNVPPGAEILEVPGLGVIVKPTSGGSYSVGPVSYEKLTDVRIVAASAGAWIEDRCDEDLVCTMTLVALDDGRETPLPAEALGGSTVISPEGAWIFSLDGEGAARLYDVERSVSVTLEMPAGVTPVWTEDGRFLMGLHNAVNRTQLWVFAADTRSTHLVDLSILRAPPLTDVGLVPFD